MKYIRLACIPSDITRTCHYRCRKLPKGLKDWQAFKDLTKKIEDFNMVCPLLERMTDPSMKDRHWKRIEEITSHHFDFESDNFQLRHVMEAPLLENMEDIEVGGANGS